jgi:hypothetical protein
VADTDNITALRPRAKDATNADRQRRFRKKRKARLPAPVPPTVTAVTRNGATPSASIDIAAYTAAIALAGAAAWFSIRGMIVLFPGAPLAIIGMAVTMESAKLVTAGWLARRWRATAWVWRLVLVVLVAGLALINAAGLYAQLVAAHVGARGAATSAIETQDAALAARIEVAAHTVADLDRRLNQVDLAIEEAAKRGRTNTALSAIEAQRKTREALGGQRQREGATLCRPQGRTCRHGRQGPANRNGGGAHPLRRRAYRHRHRQRARNPVADPDDGAVLRSVGNRVDGCGCGTEVNRDALEVPA